MRRRSIGLLIIIILITCFSSYGVQRQTERVKAHIEQRPRDAGTILAALHSPVQRTALEGIWTNRDKATRGLVKLVITVTDETIEVHAFGACHPAPCDWGNVSGIAYAQSVASRSAVAFTAIYNFGHAQQILTGHLDAGLLVVQEFAHFTDGSGRSDYFAVEYMLPDQFGRKKPPSRPAESGVPESIRTIRGVVVQILQPRAGPQVQIRSNGRVYQFALGADPGTVGHMSDDRVKAWNTTLGRLKAGTSGVIEYSVPLDDRYPGIVYGAALRARLE